VVLNFVPLVTSWLTPSRTSRHKPFLEWLKVFMDSGILFDIDSSSRKDEPEVSRLYVPSFDISSPKIGFQYFSRRLVLCDELVTFGAVHDKGVIQAGLDAVVKATVDILAQRQTGMTKFFKQAQFERRFQPPPLGLEFPLRQREATLAEDLRKLLDGWAGF